MKSCECIHLTRAIQTLFFFLYIDKCVVTLFILFFLSLHSAKIYFFLKKLKLDINQKGGKKVNFFYDVTV